MNQSNLQFVYPRIAVIGAGYWGNNIIRNLKMMGFLSGICDIDANRAKERAAHFETKVFSMRELMLDKNVDAVVLATPSHTHHFLGHQVLLHNKHLFVEKPLSYKHDEAIELIQLARHQRKKLMIGHILRYHPAFIKLLEAVKSGIIGKINHIESFRLHPYKGPACDSVLWDLTPHDLSMSFAIIDMVLPKEKQNYSIPYIDYDYDFIKCSLSFGEGLEISLTNSRKHSSKTQIFTVFGERGSLVFDDTQPWESKLYLQEHHKKIPLHIQQEEPLRKELLHFINCIVHHKPCLTDGDEALRGIKLMEQIEQLYSPRVASSYV